MGHGLMPKSGGIHVAFAAGTGALCFVDLVAKITHMAIGVREHYSSVNEQTTQTAHGNIGKTISTSGEEIDSDVFQLHLYVSFPRRSDSVALELFEALDTYCKNNKIKIFTLYTRLSQERVNPQRWDEDFIR